MYELKAISEIAQRVSQVPDSDRRVKLYEVDSETSEWCDRGTGRFFIEDSVLSDPRLIVIAEEKDGPSSPSLDASTASSEVSSPQSAKFANKSTSDTRQQTPSNPHVYLVNTHLKHPDADYRRQKDQMIITWQETDKNKEILHRALSCQNIKSANALWNHICVVAWQYVVCEDDDCLPENLRTLGNPPSDLLIGGVALPNAKNITLLTENLHTLYLQQSRNVTQEANFIHTSSVIDILRRISHPIFLRYLWRLLVVSEDANDIDVLSTIAEMLARSIILYIGSFNPFQATVFQDLFLNKDESSNALNSGGSAKSPSPGFWGVLDPQIDMDPFRYDPLLVLLSDANYLYFFKAMEYEADLLKHEMRVCHLDFFEKKVHFHEVLQGQSEIFAKTCHTVYRLLYIRDVCLPRHLDEWSMGRMTTIINWGYVVIARFIVFDTFALETLRESMNSNLESARFLQSLFTVFKSHLHPASAERASFVTQAKNTNILQPLEKYLTWESDAAKSWKTKRENMEARVEDYTALEVNTSHPSRPDPLLTPHETDSQSPVDLAVAIIHLSVEHNPAILRHAIVSSARTSPCGRSLFWFALCDLFSTSKEEGLILQVTDIFHIILNMTGVEGPAWDEFLQLFYDKDVMNHLMDILMQPIPEDADDDEKCVQNFAKGQILSVFGTCVQHHHSRIKYRLIQSNLPVTFVTKLSEQKPFNKILAIQAIKLLKIIIAIKDEVYTRQLIKNDFMKPIFRILQFHVKRPRSPFEGSILESCIWDVFDMIMKTAREVEANKLLHYIGKKYHEQLVTLDHYYSNVCKFNMFGRFLFTWNDLSSHHFVEHRNNGQQHLGSFSKNCGGPQQKQRSPIRRDEISLQREAEDAYLEAVDEEEIEVGPLGSKQSNNQSSSVGIGSRVSGKCSNEELVIGEREDGANKSFGASLSCNQLGMSKNPPFRTFCAQSLVDYDDEDEEGVPEFFKCQAAVTCGDICSDVSQLRKLVSNNESAQCHFPKADISPRCDSPDVIQHHPVNAKTLNLGSNNSSGMSQVGTQQLSSSQQPIHNTSACNVFVSSKSFVSGGMLEEQIGSPNGKSFNSGMDCNSLIIEPKRNRSSAALAAAANAASNARLSASSFAGVPPSPRGAQRRSSLSQQNEWALHKGSKRICIALKPPAAAREHCDVGMTGAGDKEENVGGLNGVLCAGDAASDMRDSDDCGGGDYSGGGNNENSSTVIVSASDECSSKGEIVPDRPHGHGDGQLQYQEVSVGSPLAFLSAAQQPVQQLNNIQLPTSLVQYDDED